ncbi:MAG: hypothetical protein OER90_14975, partial [Gemmatimonadota bacterium]|nr:hypothetical protein [Gemmatimonadota bacterium]
GANSEIAYVTEVLVPATGLLHEAIYVIPDPALGDPTPIEVYVAAGPSEADEYGVHSPVWSPWGDAIAFVEWRRTPGSSREHALRIVDRSTGAVTTVFDYAQFQGSGSGLDWSQTPSNPSFLTFVEEKPKQKGVTFVVHKLQVTDAAGNYIIGGESSLLATGFGDATWSPDDTRLLVTDFRYVKALDAQTGSVLATLTRHYATKLDWRR